ncbi:OmpA family protein [Mucilaginibacter sp. RS28]|uniref:OmpA family protein n=1 Tax=Mucilaginibacter straminoryzae TaxID=2932774 RepID=A0A9X2B879_9SPHI|nr:OmpA family protein [Mucilaginibacter straminoryzae]MCJ8208440.1 OmpA family protein [Mucilaginibacter straminoryzae]
MNYSTLKKTVALSFASLMAVGMVKAQTSTTTTTTDTTMNKSTGTTTAKVFGGRGQYNTFSIGLNGGITAPVVATGGSNDFTNWDAKFGYGASLRWQLAHSFGIQGDFHGGKLNGTNADATNGVRDGLKEFNTKFYSGTISGVVNVATIDYLRRKNAINFFVTAGAGLVWYNPTLTYANNSTATYQNADGSTHYAKSLVIPVGAGVKFRLNDAWALNLGYTENFVDDDILDGLKRGYPTKDKYSYGYAGLEWTIGSKSKPNLDWVNPVAMMYDELYDAALRQEVEALKGRVTNVENAVNDLKKDSDGDGVSDQFDKCPNTPAGTVVDGAGCPLKKDTVQVGGAAATAYSNIQFDFDSSVLRTSSYPVLDATSADLRSNTSKTLELDGYASSEGTAAHNLRLSKDRANSVKTYLVNSGVEARRLKVKAFGETNPIADNSTEEGRVQNRRVEFKQK